MAKDAVYFSHDSNARRDPKILTLRSLWGAQGYGWWWIVVEVLREQDGYKLQIDRHTLGALAFEFGGATADDATNFLDSCLEIGLLQKDESEKIYSPSLFRRMSFLEEARQKKADAARARWNKKNSKNDLPDNALHKENNALHEKEDTVHMQNPQKSCKEKIRKEKISKDNKAHIYSLFYKKWIEEFKVPSLSMNAKRELEFLSERFEFEWFERAISAAKARGGKTPSYLKPILQDWEQIGGKEPWNEVNISNSGSKRNPRLPTLDEWEEEKRARGSN